MSILPNDVKRRLFFKKAPSGEFSVTIIPRIKIFDRIKLVLCFILFVSICYLIVCSLLNPTSSWMAIAVEVLIVFLLSSVLFVTLRSILWRFFGYEKVYVQDGWLIYEKYMRSKLKRTLEFEFKDIREMHCAFKRVLVSRKYGLDYKWTQFSPITFSYDNHTYEFGWELHYEEASTILDFLKNAAHPHKL